MFKYKNNLQKLSARFADIGSLIKEISGPLALLFVLVSPIFDSKKEEDFELPPLPNLPDIEAEEQKPIAILKQVFACNTDKRYAEIMEITEDQKIASSLVLGGIEHEILYKGTNTHTSEEYKKMAELFCKSAITPNVSYESLSSKGDLYLCASLDGKLSAQSNILSKHDGDIGRLIIFDREPADVKVIPTDKIQEAARQVCERTLTL